MNRYKKHKNWALECQEFDKTIFKECDYCKNDFKAEEVGNHPTHYGEKYCESCYDELKKINEL